MVRQQRIVSSLVAMLLSGMFVTGCAIGPVGKPLSDVNSTLGSRAVLYENLEGILADSALVVTGEVVSSSESDGDKIVVTNHTFTIRKVAVGDNKIPSDATQIITIRQIGGQKHGVHSDTITPAPLLQEAQEYLLFLTNDSPGFFDYFWVTGGEAGIFVKADGNNFERLVKDSGDSLPDRISFEQIFNLDQ